MKQPGISVVVLVATLCISSVQATAEKIYPAVDQYKTGYSAKPIFGGPNSPEGQLEENDRIMQPAFRYDRIYDAFQPWTNWKRRVNEEHGFQISGHYASLYQNASESLTGNDTASSGVFRTNAKWILLGKDTKDTKDTGALVITVDNRHAYHDIAPASLAGEIGYAGITGTLFSDADWALVNLNWQQGFNSGQTGLLLGRYDPSDYMNILGYVNPWVTFQNLSVLLEPSITFGDSSWGAGIGHWINDQYYVLGGVNDANGSVEDDLEFFEGGSELYTWAHAGWSPSQSQRYTHNVHLSVWHVDARKSVDTDFSQGLSLAANWTFNDTWMPFARAGWSEGETPIYNRSATVGLVRKFAYRSDLVGIGLNWGELSSDLGDQTTVEAFWNIQFAQNLAITPSVQYLSDPALNPEGENVWVSGVRMRLTF